jgi:hypothetical protein
MLLTRTTIRVTILWVILVLFQKALTEASAGPRQRGVLSEEPKLRDFQTTGEELTMRYIAVYNDDYGDF